MNKIVKAAIVAACMATASAANAQFGALGGMVGGGKSASSSADLSGEVKNFVSQSAALSLLAGKSVAAINAAFLSEEERAKKQAVYDEISKIADPKEQAARIAALYESEAAELKRLHESGQMKERIAGLDSAKKKSIGDALGNFGIGALQAVVLTKTGQSLVQKAGANPMDLPKVLPVKDALPLLGKVATDSGGVIVGVAKLAKGANINVPAVKADSKPVDVNFG